MKKRILLIGILVFCATATAAVALTCSKDSTIFSVNGAAVTQEEYQIFLSQEKSESYVYFAKQYGAEPSATFWDTSYGGVTPLEHARQRALEACTHAKVLQIEGHRLGLVDGTGFSVLKKRWEDENLRKKGTTNQGGVVFGPVSMSLPDYYRYYQSNLENKVKETLLQKELAVTEQEIEGYYKENKALFTALGDCKTEVFFISAQNSADNARRTAKEARNRIALGEDFRQVCRELSTDCEVIEKAFTSLTEKGDIREWPTVLKLLTGMLPGEISQVGEDSAGAYIVKLVSREEDHVFPVDEVRERIRDMLLDEKYRAYFDDLLQQSTIVISQKNFESTKIE